MDVAARIDNHINVPKKILGYACFDKLECKDGCSNVQHNVNWGT